MKYTNHIGLQFNLPNGDTVSSLQLLNASGESVVTINIEADQVTRHIASKTVPAPVIQEFEKWCREEHKRFHEQPEVVE